jgi:hypothetical protein
VRTIAVFAALAVVVASSPALAQRRLATDLVCSVDEAAARTLLERVSSATDPRFGLPSSSGSQGVPRVSAARIDELLRVLFEIRVRFPPLKQRVEELVLGFRYCAIHDGAIAWDLEWRDGQVVRSAPREVPRGWSGFAAWGFGQRPPNDVPDLLRDSPLGHDQRGWFLGALVNDRCFPHPVRGPERDSRAFVPLGPPDTTLPRALGDESCVTPVTPPIRPLPAVSIAPPVVKATPEQVRVLVAPSAIPSSGGGAFPVAPHQGGLLGFSGNLSLQTSLVGQGSAGMAIGYSPRDHWFARVGLSQALGKGQKGTGYSWGIGYDDWHEGSFSVQMNDWGPGSFESRPNLKNAELDFGYKVPLPKALGKYVSSSLTLNFPFSKAPGVVATVVIKPFGEWYILVGARLAPFASPVGTWFYGFGHSNWRPFTFGLAYSNWGPNKAFVPNFDKNGSLVGTFSWAL